MVRDDDDLILGLARSFDQHLRFAVDSSFDAEEADVPQAGREAGTPRWNDRDDKGK